MHFERSSGVLLHLTSLASHGGIGDLGPAAHDFVSFLASAKQHVWQVLPLCPTGYGNSPYAGSSAFAGNPYLISLELLADWGWIAPDRIASLSGQQATSILTRWSSESSPYSARQPAIFSSAPSTTLTWNRSGSSSSPSARRSRHGSPITPSTPSSAASSRQARGPLGLSRSESATRRPSPKPANVTPKPSPRKRFCSLPSHFSGNSSERPLHAMPFASLAM